MGIFSTSKEKRDEARYFRKIIEYTKSTNTFHGLSKLLREESGAEYSGIVILDDQQLEIMNSHLHFPNKSVDNKSPGFIPKKICIESLREDKVCYLSRGETNNLKYKLSPESPVQQLLLVPTTGNFINAVVLLGSNKRGSNLNSKRLARRMKSLLDSSEWMIDFFGKYEKALELTQRDDLTIAYNRRYLETKLREEMGRATRNKSELAFVFFDLNNFKRVNENYGHYYGSKLLMHIAQKIMEKVRDADRLVRFGGDEFCVVMPNTPVEGARIVSERILKVLESLDFPTPDGKKHNISASFGISSYPEHANCIKDLICEADRAMYAAKMSNKPIMVVTKEISDKMKERNIDV